MRLQKDILQFLEDPMSNIHTEDTRKTYLGVLSRLARMYPDKAAADFTAEDLVAFCVAGNPAPNTVLNRRSVIKAFFRWASFRSKVDRNPAEHLNMMVRERSKPVKAHVWLTEEEARRILSLPDLSGVQGRRDDLILRFGFSMALRRIEITRLTWGDINLDRQEARIFGKSRKLAIAWIPDTLAERLAEWRDMYEDPASDRPVVVRTQQLQNFHNGTRRVVAHWGQGVSVYTVHAVVRRYSQQAGIRFAPHDMRRTFAGLAADRLPIEKVSAALRHSNIGTTQVYLKSRQDAAALAMRESGIDL